MNVQPSSMSEAVFTNKRDIDNDGQWRETTRDRVTFVLPPQPYYHCGFSQARLQPACVPPYDF